LLRCCELGRVLEPCYNYMGHLNLKNIDLQKESYSEAVGERTVGKGLLFPVQLPVWCQCGCLELCKEIFHSLMHTL